MKILKPPAVVHEWAESLLLMTGAVFSNAVFTRDKSICKERIKMNKMSDR